MSTGTAFSRQTRPSCGIPECTRPCYERGGVAFDYCGRAHAKEAELRGLSARAGHRTCHLGGCSNQVFICVTTNRIHDFCSKGHAEEAISKGQWIGGRSGGGASKCRLPGCHENVYRDPLTSLVSHCHRQVLVVFQAPRVLRMPFMHSPTPKGSPPTPTSTSPLILPPGRSEGTVRQRSVHWKNAGEYERRGHESNFCSKGHRAFASKNTTGVNRRVGRVIKGRITGSTNFALIVLDKANPQYVSLQSQFTSRWNKPGVPTVQSILEVQVPLDVYNQTLTYKRSTGNVRRRFHGTSCSTQCSFFVDLKGSPCGRKECNVCSICTHGFRMQGNVGGTARRTSIGLRYGKGLYFSSVSGKANDYASPSEKTDSNGRRVRCVFVANVAAGNTYNTTQVGLQPTMCPPNGYNSVVGEVGAGLNHDELVVYNDEAALPTHMIVYALP
ncbi:unnamed protein product [Scytosiphon promiscuus]